MTKHPKKVKEAVVRSLGLFLLPTFSLICWPATTVRKLYTDADRGTIEFTLIHF